ncbi:NAD(P)/FAD-dependent oxidoreductase [Nocardiopsis exhalans]|uniref:NADPH-dependent 2,4-dienoyl-CoA reductase/sulfur reductase-like enzyme n=2 Tax=Nocardiopsis TaxID=2013 RepID=A0A840W5K2_9ACTN|nr:MULTISPECIES: FAD-dependent oxidoreductase [Nocardiopsis]MBB5492240.1 NADPH-dependent 2,4-dienoyl-CoA reductase/sulfur reductase-like enzyme [Nocardiopsis metallicus]USY18705.1 NAD(P)/FAD-dependent oxidoreductase [Nocardiopsis exhalans]
MSAHQVVVLGAGAAGAAAARELITARAVDVTLVGASGREPYNRTLVNKGVALGLITPEQAALTPPNEPFVADTARRVDVAARRVHLDSGATLGFDSLIVATGSTPRRVHAELRGARDAVRAGRLTTLHSLRDALGVRDLLARTPRPARVIILGAGLVAAETASVLHQAGHDIALLARTTTPGRTALGDLVARRVADLHRTHICTYFARQPVAVTPGEAHVGLVLDDGTRVEADLVIEAIGTTPVAPQPWPNGVDVGARLHIAGAPRAYGAGGVAIHRGGLLGSWRIDHWGDAAAQGGHAARTLLYDLGLGADPGPYLPRANFAARVYGRTLTGVGHNGSGARERCVSTDPLLVVHEVEGRAVGAVGIDAVRLVQEWAPRLHA